MWTSKGAKMIRMVRECFLEEVDLEESPGCGQGREEGGIHRPGYIRKKS